MRAKRWLRRIGAGVLVLVVGGIFWGPWLALETVAFSQSPRFVSAQAFSSVLESYVGKNSMNVVVFQKLGRELVRQFPSIESVNVTLSGPHGVLVHVTEKTPTVVFVSEVSSWLIAEDGTVLDRIEGNLDERYAGLVRLRGVSEESLLQPDFFRRVLDRVWPILSEVKTGFSAEMMAKGVDIQFESIVLEDRGTSSGVVTVYQGRKMPIYCGDVVVDRGELGAFFKTQMSTFRAFMSSYSGDVSRIGYIDLRVVPKVILGRGT